MEGEREKEGGRRGKKEAAYTRKIFIVSADLIERVQLVKVWDTWR